MIPIAKSQTYLIFVIFSIQNSDGKVDFKEFKKMMQLAPVENLKQ